MNKRKVVFFFSMLFFAAGGVWSADNKQDFPQGHIDYLIGFAPGGKTDTQARGMAPYVEKYLGARLNLQNFPGAGGRIGYTKLYKAAPDGYTIGILPLPAIVLGEQLAAVDYKTKDFTPIFACFLTPQILAVPEGSYKNLEEFISAAKSKSLTNATPGIGTSPHLAALAMENGLGLKPVRQVHYESGGAALVALAGKHVDFSVASTTNLVPLVQAGKLKALLTFGDERDKAFPDVPTPKELGLSITAIPAVDGVAGPPNLPLDKVRILEAAFTKAAADPEFLAWAERSKMTIVPMNHERYHQVILGIIKEVERYKHLMVAK